MKEHHINAPFIRQVEDASEVMQAIKSGRHQTPATKASADRVARELTNLSLLLMEARDGMKS